MISIIIPTRNEGKYLERTLKQYLPYKKSLQLEVIVSDGGSIDNTLRIAEKYADKIVRANKRNKQTIAKGRNEGAKVAKGELLFSTDADVIVPDKKIFFKRVREIFKNENVVAATTRVRVYPEEEQLKDKVIHMLNDFTVWLINHIGSFIAKGECQIIRASAFRKLGGYNDKLVMGEDADLFHRLSKLGKIVYMKDLIVYHSPRRFRNQGYLKTYFIYAREFMHLIIKGKSSLKEWPEQR